MTADPSAADRRAVSRTVGRGGAEPLGSTPAAPDVHPGEVPGAAEPDGHPVPARRPAPAAGPDVSLDDTVVLGILDEEDLGPALPRRRHFVTAVIVAHDGALWLPAVLTTLAAQTRPPDDVIGVDTGSHDASAGLLAESLGPDRVLRAPRTSGFGEAVRAGLADAPEPALPDDVVRWVWLLHDDSAPDPGCLQALLDTADDNPSAEILGAKVRGWHDRRLLLEAGVTIAGSGRRETGLERREHDQGQHDGVRDVLSVSSAGMLVRRDVWAALDGFDPALPLFRDDLDFCWRAHRAGYRVLVATGAVMHHREAGAHGRRRLSISPPRPHEADRSAALHVLLSQTPTWRLPFTTVRLVLAGLLRTVGFLVGKDLGDARDELAALVYVLVHPGRVRASRARVRATSTRPRSETRALRPRPGAQARQALEAFGGVITTGRGSGSAVGALESGPADEDAAYLDDTNPGWLRRALMRPGIVLTLLLLIVAVVATRTLWWGAGTLLGGALLPSPAGAADLWRSYTEAWHEVGPGSSTPAPPYLAVLAALASLLLGKAPVAVQAVLLLVVPIAGMSAYASLRGVVRSGPVRFWAAATYALLPAVTGAVAAGRLGTAMLAILLPPLARMAVRCAGLGGGSLRVGTARTAWAGALLLAVVAAFAPIVWVLVAILVVAATLTVARTPGARRRLAALVVVPVLLLLPWSAYVAVHPVLLLLEPGLAGAGLTDPGLTPLDVLLLHPGGPGMTPVWLTVGVVAVAAGAMLRRDRLRVALMAWVVAVLALLAGTLQALVSVTPPDAQAPVRTWPGPATLVLGLALITAAAGSADGLRARVRGANFGWRQPAAAVVLLVALFAPVLSAGWWLPGAGDPLRRADATTVPAFVAADSAGPDRPRTLVLRREAGGRIAYALVDGPGPRLGDADVSPPAESWDRLDPIVAALASGRGGVEVVQLAGYAVRFVQLADPSAEGLVRTLDSEPGLRRLSSAGGEALWRIAGVTSRVRMVGPAGGQDALPATPEEVGDPLVDTDIPAGPSGRSLLLSETADPGWRATADGADLDRVEAPATADWAQAFALPAEAATVVAGYDGTTRTRWLWLQLAIVIVVVVLALPARREEDPDPDVGPDDEPRGSGQGDPVAAPAVSRSAPAGPARGAEEGSA